MIEAAIERTRQHRVPGPALRVAEAAAGMPERAELEAFVRTAFARKHDASVSSFMPTLLSFRDASGELRGVIGVRGAAPQPLYLEQYLEQPVEAAIAAATGRFVQRHEVVEVGNLAGANCRAAMRMVATLPSYLLVRDYRWIVFTATSAVRGILQGFRAPLVELARAENARVAHGDDRWGRYYDSDPRVLAGYLPSSRGIPGFSLATHDR
ncbi:MAG: thermostable hemolysin [Steroidobacteraceae bacterium]|nr:thermostable hemolysin [Steroidobacteraceae bacterium]